MATDLERAFKALNGKQNTYTTLWHYYDGDHPLVYSAERLREVFQDRFASFSLNWCAVVIDSVLDRVTLDQFDVATDKTATTTLNDLFADTELALDAADVHKAALVTGESFVFVWRQDDGTVEAYYNDPRLCHVFYDDENPRIKSFAAKWWVGADERRYLNLYYPNSIEYYASSGKATDVNYASAFSPLEESPAENPFGEIPIFHFRPERRVIKSELANVLAPQNAINKLLADMMVGAEFGAFPQRWIISNADIGQLKNAPNEVWDLPAGDGAGQGTTVGAFPEADLNNYLNAIDKLANSVAIITHTPKHYFFGQGGDPSGEALVAMEAPLNKKAQGYIDRFIPTWRRVAAFMLKVAQVPVGEVRSVSPHFERPETVQPRTEAEIRQINGQAGIPLVTTLRREGWTQDEIDQMLKDRQEQKAEETASLAQALLEAERRQQQQVAEAVPGTGNGTGVPTGAVNAG